MSKIRVYVAGRLNDPAIDYLRNVHRMMLLAERVRLAGFAVYVPALDLLMGIMFGTYEYRDCFDNSQPWLEAAEAVIVEPLGAKTSKGTQAEIARANALSIPVFWTEEDLLAWAQATYPERI